MDEMKGDYRQNPPGMLRHMKKIDILKTFKATWAQADRVERVLERLLTQENGQPGQQAIARPGKEA